MGLKFRCSEKIIFIGTEELDFSQSCQNYHIFFLNYHLLFGPGKFVNLKELSLFIYKEKKNKKTKKGKLIFVYLEVL